MQRISAAFALLLTTSPLYSSGHGPVFALATPTNPKGGFSFDTSMMSRFGDGSGTMLRATLGYGITEDLKISVSAPVIFQSEPFLASRTAATTPMGGDFEALGLWRFQRTDFKVGGRFETTAIGGLLLPGPQATSGPLENRGLTPISQCQPLSLRAPSREMGCLTSVFQQPTSGPLKGMNSRPGGLVGLVSGIASRSHYAWAGATYQRYAASDGDRRPDQLFYSFAYAYRPQSWRKDNGWDWRIFGECTGERTGSIQRAAVDLPGSRGNQVFVGPSTLGVYKNYAISAGVQFVVHQDVGNLYPRERVRAAINFTIFF